MSTEERHSPRELPIACKVADKEQGRRQEKLARELFSGWERTNELDDGYEFVFSGEASRAEKLVSFIVFERRCCPFLIFEISFEQEEGPITLRMRGPEGTKEFLGAGELAEYIE